MFEDEEIPQQSAILAITGSDWRPIFHDSNQVVLYNPTSHALSIRSSSHFPKRSQPPCPYCKQPLPLGFESDSDFGHHEDVLEVEGEPTIFSRASNYFRLLAIANESSSRSSTPPLVREDDRRAFPAEQMAEGYFKAFFREEAKLGMGANGSVFLCQHLLDGNPLGHFAIKKIAVGESHSYLLQTLREVRLLEQLHHPNIITYHHAWLETSKFSSFGPKVPTLHVLMQWAEGGSLDDFIDVRLGRKAFPVHFHPSEVFTESGVHFADESPSLESPAPREHDINSRSARKRAFRAFQKASPQEKERLREQMADAHQHNTHSWRPIHLLSAEEAKSLFQDVTRGLAFLHDKSILHLDLKPGNVLLTWDDDKLIPRAMLSDFGTSRDMMQTSRTRSGNTGTLEYSSPESLPSPTTGLLQSVNSKADMWSLGMILHKLLFFKLPYRYAASGDSNGEATPNISENTKMNRLEQEILEYPGFKYNDSLTTSFKARRLPRAYLVLLESLLNPNQVMRPSSDRVSHAVNQGTLDPLIPQSRDTDKSLVPIARIPPDPDTPRPSGHIVDTNDEQISPGVSDHVDVALVDDKTPGMLVLPSSYQERTTPQDVPISKIFRIWPLCLRTIKSGLLVAKVINVIYLCPYGQPKFMISWFLLLLPAIADTWFDELQASVVFGLLHVIIVKIGMSLGACSLI